MKKILAAICFIFPIVLSSGCGSGSSPAQRSSHAAGVAVLTIKWPAVVRSASGRFIPLNATKIVVTYTKDDNTVGTATATPSSGPSPTATITITDALAGANNTFTVDAEDGSSNILAAGSAAFDLVPGVTTTLPITLVSAMTTAGSSALTVSPATFTLAFNQSPLPLTVTTKVPVQASSLTWSGSANLQFSTTNGLSTSITALKPGPATVTVTYQEQNLSPISVTVSGTVNSPGLTSVLTSSPSPIVTNANTYDLAGDDFTSNQFYLLLKNTGTGKVDVQQYSGGTESVIISGLTAGSSGAAAYGTNSRLAHLSSTTPPLWAISSDDGTSLKAYNAQANPGPTWTYTPSSPNKIIAIDTGVETNASVSKKYLYVLEKTASGYQIAILSPDTGTLNLTITLTGPSSAIGPGNMAVSPSANDNTINLYLSSPTQVVKDIINTALSTQSPVLINIPPLNYLDVAVPDSADPLLFYALDADSNRILIYSSSDGSLLNSISLSAIPYSTSRISAKQGSVYVSETGVQVETFTPQ